MNRDGIDPDDVGGEHRSVIGTAAAEHSISGPSRSPRPRL